MAAAVPAKQVKWSGKLIPAREVSLSFRTGGRLAERRVDVGTRVDRGVILARLDATQSREQVLSARAALSEADAQLRKAKQDVERMVKLVEIGTASRARLQEATSTLAAAQAQRSRATAQLAEATNDSDFNLLRAPFEGVITAVTASPGQILSQD
ncbi:efflux RND transporter periplasmic adaptor subunit [Tatumella morbirosei]|uniref:efflux RND transporter periplasmic adaptor subunit n=1 Tax=Tatumella morbirosei TaxID=642227 RepID=UPI0014704F83|nr:efflux RND transporter periplasmic adaptor subunit [Tatumella morbirosei]